MEVLVILVCLLHMVTSQQPVRMMNSNSLRCVDDANCTAHSTCNDKNECECYNGYEYDDEKNCKQCPGPDRSCEGCCYPPSRYKCVGEQKKTCVCWRNCNDSFVLAAQVALGSALTIAVLALAALFWKTCSCHRGSNGHLSPLLREQEGSLTSTQQFILRRLRDRPPRYEANNHIQLEKPPAYQVAVTDCEVPCMQGISPPVYSEAVNTLAGSSATEGNKPAQEANTLTTDTRTLKASENRQLAEIAASNCSQLDGVDNTGFTLHEVKQTHPAETELHM